jgi:hypothetical protein
VLPRPQFATLQSATFPIFFPLQTALSAIIALTYPGMKTAIGTRDAAGWSGVFHETNRWGVLVPVATMFFSGLVNWVWLGPETYRVMKMRKHQGMFLVCVFVCVLFAWCCVVFDVKVSGGNHANVLAETRDGKKSYDAAPHSAEMQKLNRQFGMLHGFSSLANVVGLGAMIVYAGTLAEIL